MPLEATGGPTRSVFATSQAPRSAAESVLRPKSSESTPLAAVPQTTPKSGKVADNEPTLDHTCVVVFATEITPDKSEGEEAGCSSRRVVFSHSLAKTPGQPPANPGKIDEETLKQVEEHYRERGFSNVSVFPNLVHASEGQDPRELVDPLRSDQFHLELMNVRAAHTISNGKSSVLVAIMDDGYSPEHSDNPIHLKPGYDFSDGDDDPTAEGGTHGQHVMTIVGMNTGNEVGGSSAAPGVALMPIRWYGGKNRWDSKLIVDSLVYAVDNGAKIINISYNTDSWPQDKAILAALEYAADRDVIVVASAGNNRQQDPVRGSIENMVFVASLDGGDGRNAMKRSWFSNYGTQVDYAAIGGNVLAAVPVGGSASESEQWLAGVYDKVVAAMPEIPAPPRRDFLLQDASAPAVCFRRLATLLVRHQSGYGEFFDRLMAELSDGFARKSGTSMAAPNAAAVMALVRSYRPEWNRFQVLSAVKASCIDIDGFNPNYVGKLGAGAVNAEGALKLAVAPGKIPASRFNVSFDGRAAYVAPTGVLDPRSVSDDKAFTILTAAGEPVATAGPVGDGYEPGTNRLVVDLEDLDLEPGQYTLRIDESITDAFGRPTVGDKEIPFKIVRNLRGGGSNDDGPGTLVLPENRWD